MPFGDVTPSAPSGPLDLRLVAVDMDGTLLDDRKRLPEGFWPLLAELTRRGVVVAPASGRQYESLRRMFAPRIGTFIAENGALLVHEGAPIATDPLPTATVADVLASLSQWRQAGNDGGVVLCGVESAYVEHADGVFGEAIAPYYPLLTPVPSLQDVRGDEVLKVAAWDPVSSQSGVARLIPPGPDRAVLLSGQHWVDVMSPTADKGHALRTLQGLLGITPAQTVAFGDFHNDIGMLAAAEHSFAMAGAHPDVLAVARHRAPSNNEAGVLTVLRELFSLSAAAH